MPGGFRRGLLGRGPGAGAGKRLQVQQSAGDRGKAIKALEIRVVGWFPEVARKRLKVNRAFGRRTVRAVRAFQRHYNLVVDGIAGPQTFGPAEPSGWGWIDGALRLRRVPTAPQLELHSESEPFRRDVPRGRVGRRAVKRNVRRLMWRLEAIRAKGNGRPVTVESGFRSVAYNNCIGAGSLSQHLYGTAADIKIAHMRGHRERTLARGSQIHGIECYSSLSHNHIDLRIENTNLGDYRFWYWPKRDRRGRDLTSDSQLCLGER
jgi:zinc D-Ala-D-Ala carboxypeptidase